MDDEKRRSPRDLSVLTEKAVRRGKKLEKTLVKIVARSEPGSAAEGFLKAARSGLKELRKEAKERGRSLPAGKKKAASREPQGAARDERPADAATTTEPVE